jgi:hypothetical protein
MDSPTALRPRELILEEQVDCHPLDSHPHTVAIELNRYKFQAING